MAISINSVIHYTERIDYLTGILRTKGFKLKYCCEEIDIQMPSPISAAYPMVSFCDIPLSEVKNHIDSYGSYGIGLTKSWAKKKKLNPVLYLEKDSGFSLFLNQQVNKIFDIIDRKKVGTDVPEGEFALLTDMIIIMSYCKNYEGELVRGKINSENYRFYDEREWRYIPNLDELNGARRSIEGIFYKKSKDEYNKLLENINLSFDFSDISYIIVDSENEIPEILTVLNEIYEDVCTSKELKILSTKIITKNQIYNDF